MLHWHAGFDGCPCHCEQHHYRDWDEFKAFVRADNVVVVDEYEREWNADEFIVMLERWRDENNRSHARQHTPREAVEIDGWEFLGGHWE